MVGSQINVRDSATCTTLRGNQREALLKPTACLRTLVADLVFLKVHGRDGAVLLESLSQCLSCTTRTKAAKGHQQKTLRTCESGLSTVITDAVVRKTDGRDGAVVLEGLS